MDTHLLQHFSLLCGELCNHLYIKEYDKGQVNVLIDELNTKPYKSQLFVRKPDASTLITALYLNIKPADDFLTAKTSHLINHILTRQNLQFDLEYLNKVVSWYIDCLKKCSEIIQPDILHNLQCILHTYPQASHKMLNGNCHPWESATRVHFLVAADTLSSLERFDVGKKMGIDVKVNYRKVYQKKEGKWDAKEELIGNEGILINLINTDKSTLSTVDSLQTCLIALKCIICIVTSTEEKGGGDGLNILAADVKERISTIIVRLLMRGSAKHHDEFLYCKIIISALRVLTNLYYNDQNVNFSLPEVMGICQYFILFGLVKQALRPEMIMPAQQTIAVTPIPHNTKGGKKQKLRKQRNNAIESLKKEIPVSDRSLMKDVDNFENNSAYKPASSNYLEAQKPKNCLALTSDSDMSDVENSREAKLIALKSRVRQSASNLLLVLVKIKEKKEIFGYWWALLPDAPDACNWLSSDSSKKTLAYCATTDPIASSRASVLSVILALLSGSRIYLAQAETRVLINILDTERSHTVIIVALKCCAALVQATPYHKMKDGLINELVRSTRKFLVHRDVTLQVGALITMGCVLSVDPKVDEVLKSVEKDTVPTKLIDIHIHKTKNNVEYDDFEEGYSDDEMFTADHGSVTMSMEDYVENPHFFRSWILDICFKNMGWIFRGNEVMKCRPSAIPLILESLQVLSAVAFHYLHELLNSHCMLLGDILSEMLQHEHQDVILQTSRTISIIGDAIQKLEHIDQAPPLNHCVCMWEKLIPPLSTVLQCHDNAPAKGIVCDCIANIGERCYKELPRRLQVLCCALLVGSCSDEEATVRAAAVRALAMAVMYRTLREDICFVSDCGENILRALSEPSLVVRTKAAWALGNLSDALVLNMEEPDIDDIDDDLLVRLLEVSIQCALDNDKVKMSATRGLGNLLRLIKSENLLRNAQIKTLCETAIMKLLDCACKVTNMKVRWNACYAMGNAMKNDQLFTCFNGWQSQVFPSLCTLAQECKNLKVRINAATALRAPSARSQYGHHFTYIWRGVMVAMENAANVDDFTEYKHKDNLIEQLCVTLAHLCCLLTQTDLTDILDPLVFHYDCAKTLFTQLCHKLPPENASCLRILQAAKYVTVDLTAANDIQMQALSMLQDIFIWDM